MDKFTLVAENPESTVVAEYQSPYRLETAFQSEADLENAFIEQLKTQAYEYLSITSEDEFISNLRSQLEILNDYKFTDKEWEQFFKGKLLTKTTALKKKLPVYRKTIYNYLPMTMAR